LKEALKKYGEGHTHCVVLLVLSVGTSFTEAQSLTHTKRVELKKKPLSQ
jgi:hypothetical protein